MQRLIEFRGQDEEKNWHFGNYDKDNNEIFYTHTDTEGIHRVTIPIIPETVSEFVVLDSNKKPIYENDIVACDDGIIENIGVVQKYQLDWCVFHQGKAKGRLWWFLQNEKVRVIGNKFDNPELIEK